MQRKIQGIKEVQESLNKQIETLTAYRKSLIHECVTGQRQVTEADLQRPDAAQSVCAVRQSS
jgi:type I restriction enzyme S subunit